MAKNAKLKDDRKEELIVVEDGWFVLGGNV